MLDEKLQEEVDALAGVAPGDLILVLAEQHQQAGLVAQHGGRGLLLGRAGSEQSQAWLLGDTGAGPPDFPPLSTRRRGPSAGSAARKRLSPRPQGGPSPLWLQCPRPERLVPHRFRWEVRGVPAAIPCVRARMRFFLPGAVRFFFYPSLSFGSCDRAVLRCGSLCARPA